MPTTKSKETNSKHSVYILNIFSKGFYFYSVLQRMVSLATNTPLHSSLTLYY